MPRIVALRIIPTIYIQNQANDSDVILETDDGSGGTAEYIRCDGSTGEVKLFRYGAEKLRTKSDGVNVEGELECDTLDVDGNADVNGQLVSNRLVVRDNGASSPLVAIRADDASPWAFNIGNDTYSSSDTHGLRIYQADDGTLNFRNSGNSAWEGISIQQQNGNTTNTGIYLDTSRAVSLRYQGSEKFITKSDGVLITGELESDSLDVNGGANITGNVDINAYVRHNGDTNTYLGFPANDTITTVTGGTQRFRITSTGALSIGSSNTAYGSSGQVLTSNGNGAPSWQDADGGKILQVVGSTQLSAPSSTTSTSTLLYNSTTVSITPSASSSKILFMYSQGIQVDVDNDGQGANNGLVQFEYKIGSGSYTWCWNHRISARGGNNMSSIDIVTISPNTTSTVTFRVGIRKHEGSRAIAYTNIFGANAITLMEIAG